MGLSSELNGKQMSCPEERLYYYVLSLLISLSLCVFWFGGARKGWCNLFLLTPDIPTAVWLYIAAVSVCVF